MPLYAYFWERKGISIDKKNLLYSRFFQKTRSKLLNLDHDSDF